MPAALLMLAASTVVSAASAAQAPSSDEPLTLAAARSLALARNWELLASRAELDLAEAQRLVAGALPNPQLSASLTSSSSDNLAPGNGPSGSANVSAIGLSELVEIGKRGNRIQSSESARSAAQARFEFARASLDAAVIKGYVAALAADAAVRINRASAASLARAADIAAARESAGEISRVERDQVAIAAGRFEADTKSAEAAALQARIALQMLLGVTDPDGKVALADDAEKLRPLGASLAARALEPASTAAEPEARGDVRAAGHEAERTLAELKLQKALRIPDPTLEVGWQHDQTLPSPNSFGLGVSFTLPLLSWNKGGVRAAEVARDSALRTVEQTKARARSEVAAARAAYAAAVARRSLVYDQLLPKAESVQQTVAFAYEKGGASLLELLEAERNANDLRLAALGTIAESLSALADLAGALGETLE
jgi:cobalt-zinc-cadmium efflux system outer membrane protein